MKAARLHPPHDLRIEAVAAQEAGPRSVSVRVREPMILGHEVAADRTRAMKVQLVL